MNNFVKSLDFHSSTIKQESSFVKKAFAWQNLTFKRLGKAALGKTLRRQAAALLANRLPT